MSYHQFQIFEKIGTEESQIDASIELSERINLCIQQNTYFLSNSPNTYLNKVHFTSGEHLSNFVVEILY